MYDLHTCVITINELFVIARVDDILNTASNKYYSIAVINNIHNIFVVAYIGRANQSLTWLSGRDLALCVKGLGSNPVSYTFYFIISFYLEHKPTDPSRGAGLSASAELLVK